jgi:protein-S-isoprenylcysteine O-methyltransferase Ste14
VLVVHAGAVGYATLFALSIPILTGHGVLGAALMVASAVATSGLAWTLRPMRDVYSFGAVRGIELGPSSLFRIRLLTLAQIVVVWSVFLVLLPFVAFRVEEVLGLDGYRFPAVARGFGWALLPVTAALNLWLAVYTTGHGQGTPLPFAAMRRLVVTGPYAHVRNPMLMVSVAVGLCASVGMGSPAMVAFFLIGAVFWNEVLRPLGGTRPAPPLRPRLRALPATRPLLGSEMEGLSARQLNLGIRRLHEVIGETPRGRAEVGLRSPTDLLPTELLSASGCSRSPLATVVTAGWA